MSPDVKLFLRLIHILSVRARNARLCDCANSYKHSLVATRINIKSNKLASLSLLYNPLAAFSGEDREVYLNNLFLQPHSNLS